MSYTGRRMRGLAALMVVLFAGASVRLSQAAACAELDCCAKRAAVVELVKPALPDCCSLVPDDGEHREALPPVDSRVVELVATEVAVESANPSVRAPGTVAARLSRAPPALYARNMARLL